MSLLKVFTECSGKVVVTVSEIPLRQFYRSDSTANCGLMRIFLVALVLCALVQGCANATIQYQANQLEMSSTQFNAGLFSHQVYSLQKQYTATAQLKIILIDGDGRAFINRTTIARDPTPSHSSLLAMAPAFAALGSVFYLGRPCYHYLEDAACNPLYWTGSRYGAEVVESMTEVVGQLLAQNEQAVLVGFSGGGVLAMLIANELPSDILAVVTFGSPLDTTSWTEHHGYTRLSGSINPADEVELYAKICQLHLYGRDDQVVPPSLIESWHWPTDSTIAGLPVAHSCCWQDILLAMVARQINTCQE